jgi:hypothetical protein
MSENPKTQRRDALQKVSSETIKRTLTLASLRARYIKLALAMEAAGIPPHTFDQAARESYLLGLSHLEKATQKPLENL